jgi:hypothetical protein
MTKVRHGWAGSLFIAAILICFPSSARADAGIAMMPVRYPQLLLFLVPVVLIESIYIKRHLLTQWRRTLVAVTSVNVVTMGLGYPLAYGIYAALNWSLHSPEDLGTVFTHLGWLPVWLCERLFPTWAGVEQSGAWPVLSMFVVLLLPSFVLTGVVKGWLLDGYDLLNFRGSTKQAVWVATRLSYLFLTVTGCVILFQTVNQMPGAQ